MKWAKLKALLPLTSLASRGLNVNNAGPIQTSNTNLCVDVVDNKLQNSQPVQIWKCHSGDNQVWNFNNNEIKTQNNMCLDVPNGNAYNGAALQVWQCAGNRNQKWTNNGDQVQFQGTNFCLDVKDASYKDGTRLQLWQCSTGNKNQQFFQKQMSSQPIKSQGGGGNFLGLEHISFDDFVQRFPVLKEYKASFLQASSDQRVSAVLLGSIAMQESDGRPWINGNGMFQFSDDNAWRKFGNGGSKTNAVDSIWGAARYMRYLLDYYNNNLYDALNNYSGSGSVYFADIQTWASGNTPRSHQRKRYHKRKPWKSM